MMAVSICDGLLTLERERAQECGWTCTPFPAARDTAETPALLASEGHHLCPSYSSLQAMTVRLRANLFAKTGN